MSTGRPRLLDLFAGAGGAARGYWLAGFDVVGVDIAPQPNYPFEFHQADALDTLDGCTSGVFERDFDAIHASPPCQGYTTMNNRHGSVSPRLIEDVRHGLRATGVPYVIENVSGAKRHLRNPIELTGEMFGLGVHRPRLFETSWMVLAPSRPPRQQDAAAVYGKNDGRRLWTRTDGTELRCANLEEASVAMGIDWMTWDEIREAIPPAYTKFIGEQLLSSLTAVGGRWVSEQTQWPQFEERVLPCEGCGADVVFASTHDVASEWADDQLAVWCPDCWQRKFGEAR